MNDNPNNPYAPTEVKVDDVRSQVDLELASRGSRLGAAIIDTVPFMVIGGVAGFMEAMSSASGTSIFEGSRLLFVLAAALFMLILVAINCMLLHRNGQTIGKKILGIKIVRSNGDRIGLGRIFLLRALPMWLLGMLPFIGYLISLVDSLMIFRESRKCLHDDIADTVVILA